MGVINQLDMSIANLIAAGEVVDRPASVVKELMENSIDAGATSITVEIKNGGISFIRVTDDGVGMTKDDAVLCLLRHATSKIKTEADLVGIVSLGFRGEALAAISSVARVRIMTKKEFEPMGTLVESEPSQKPAVTEMGCKKGTTVIVEELFANFPARRKFLKNDRSEGMAVAAVVEKIALSRPDIAIKFIQDNNQRIATVGDKKVYNTMYSLFGRDFAKKTIKVDHMTGGVAVSGYIGQPDNVRSNRNFENFFVNGRYVKSKTASAAVEQAYSSYLPTDKFPCCILYIDLHPVHLDVNVHPTKLEVRFSDERAVFDGVYCAVKNAIMKHSVQNQCLFEKQSIPDSAIKTFNTFSPVYDRMDKKDGAGQVSILNGSEENLPKKAIDKTPFDEVFTLTDSSVNSVTSEDKPVFEKLSPVSVGESLKKEDTAYSVDIKPNRQPLTDKVYGDEDKSPSVDNIRRESSPGLTAGAFSNTAASQISKDTNEKTEVTEVKEETNKDGDFSPQAESSGFDKPLYKYLGVVFDTYILVEHDKKMLMIDKHAAHERILFEKMKKNMAATMNKHQQVRLFPNRVAISKEEYGACELYREDICAVGFEFELDPVTSCASIGTIPGGIDNSVAIHLFIEIAATLASGTGNPGVTKNMYFEKALYQASCKAAVKGGKYDSENDMRYIVEVLLTDPSIRYCPHGRPVMFEVSKGTIENKFKRT